MDTKAKRDFFISYTGKDTPWAAWIAGTLEQAGYTTIFQPCDFCPGEDFVQDMQFGLINSDRFIPVLSADYMTSVWGRREWTAALAKDPSLEQAKFIPVRVTDIEPEGMFASIIYIDLFGKSEAEAEGHSWTAFRPTAAPEIVHPFLARNAPCSQANCLSTILVSAATRILRGGKTS